MELNDPNLPDPANDWLLVSSDQVRAFVEMLQHDHDANPIAGLATTLLAIAEGQARIIADLTIRVDALERA
jgi:hypothetical protein